MFGANALVKVTVIPVFGFHHFPEAVVLQTFRFKFFDEGCAIHGAFGFMIMFYHVGCPYRFGESWSCVGD